MIRQFIPGVHVYGVYKDEDGGGFGDGADCGEFEDSGYSDVYWGAGYQLMEGNGYGSGDQYSDDLPILDVPS